MEQEEYSVILGQIGNLTNRRQQVTSTYLSVNTAVTGAIAFLFKDVQTPTSAFQLSIVILLCSGIVACDLWRRLSNQYAELMRWWYARLRQVESSLPESSQHFTNEYNDLYVHQDKKATMIGLTRYETRLTWLFTAVYGFFALALLAALLKLV